MGPLTLPHEKRRLIKPPFFMSLSLFVIIVIRDVTTRTTRTRMIITTFTLFFVLLAFDALACSRTREKTLKTDLFATGFANTEIIIFHPACRFIELLKKTKIARLKTFHRQNNAFRIGYVRFISANLRLVSLIIAFIELLKYLTTLFLNRLANLVQLIFCQIHDSPTLSCKLFQQTESFGARVGKKSTRAFSHLQKFRQSLNDISCVFYG